MVPASEAHRLLGRLIHKPTIYRVRDTALGHTELQAMATLSITLSSVDAQLRGHLHSPRASNTSL